MTDENATEGGAEQGDRLNALAAISSTYKVRGKLGDVGATGVFGYSTAGTGTGRGVLGRVDSSDNGAAGVRGETSSTNGTTYGVQGMTASTSTGAAGVKGEATGTSGAVHGVYGATSSSGGYGVYSNDDAKVAGDLTVTGNASATNVNASNDVTAGSDLHATGDVTAAGILDVAGYQNIGDVGSTAYLESDVSVPNNTLTQVPFDTVQVDDRREFDVGGHVHVVQSPGDYHVTSAVRWGTEAFSTFSDEFSLSIMVNDTPRARLFGQHGRGGNISKTLRNLEETDQISIWVEQNTGSGANLRGDQWGTFVTVDKIG